MILGGTGHRPQKLPCKFDHHHPWGRVIRAKIYDYLKKNRLNIEFVISGGALGFDQWLAQSALRLNIPYKLYIPCKNYDFKWSISSRTFYHKLADNAKETLIMHDHYDVKFLFERNIKIVDDSDLLLTLLDPTTKKGGTYSTVQYALKKGKKVEYLWNDIQYKYSC